MKMRLAIVLGMAIALSQPASAALPNREEKQLAGLADEFVAARLERDPDIAYRFGLELSERLQGRLLDRTPGSQRRFDSTVDDLTRRLSRIDRRRLDREHLVLRALLQEELAVYAALRVCNRSWWDVSHIGGWMADILDLAQIEPGGTPATRAASLRRWATLPASVETHISNLETGLAKGYSAPRILVERTIAQLDALISSPLAGSPLYSPAVRDPDAVFAEKLRALTEGPNREALRRYRSFLAETYLPRARTTMGLNALPNGPACYRAFFRRHTSLTEPPEQFLAKVEAANLAGVAAGIEAGAAHYGTRDARELLRKAREDPAEHYSSSAEMLADAQQTAIRARQDYAPFFLRMPGQELKVQPYPEGRRGLNLPMRYFASGDPAVPATTWVSDDRFDAMPRAVLRSTIFHEGIPGHHMVGARMAERAGHPLLRLAYQGAFDEGWALYAERLALEAGLASTAGKVILGINRAKLSLFDLSIHQRGWDKARLEAHFRDRGGLGQQVEERFARAAAVPAQLLSYAAGELTILELRSEAERRLGPRFSLPQFHEIVLRDGWVPLWFLRENVREWIAEEERRPANGPSRGRQ
jgi:uncharacterized protein (DUF885 family)